MRVALTLGLDHFGENRVQEAADKAPQLPTVRWQMIGQLQSNKASRAVELFDSIQSVDSFELASRIGRLALDRGRAPYPVFLQVNVDDDPQKSGFTIRDLHTAVAQLFGVQGIEIRGLMTVGRLVATPQDARATFCSLREASERLRADHPQIGGALSMGMSDDYAVAVEEGATVVRLGRVLFGARLTA